MNVIMSKWASFLLIIYYLNVEVRYHECVNTTVLPSVQALWVWTLNLLSEEQRKRDV